MGVPPRGGDVMRSGLDDLVTFNRWLCMTRLRAAGAVVVFTLALEWLGIGDIASAPALAACAGLFVVSGIGLSWDRLARAPRVLFYLQSLADLAGITFGIGASAAGVEALPSAALLDVARTLSSTLEAPEILARLNSTTSQQLGADWSGTFLVDPDFGTFRLVAATDADAAAGEPERLEFPVSGWAPVGRLAGEPVVVLTAAEAACTPGLGRSGRVLSTMILAALYHERVLAGFLAVGFGSLPAPEREQAVEVLS